MEKMKISQYDAQACGYDNFHKLNSSFSVLLCL